MAQQQNNYFTANINRWGREDFIYQLKPEQIQRDAKNRVFREMVNDRIDYSKYGNYFLDPKFLENLIISASNELSNNVTIYNALCYYETIEPRDGNVSANKVRFNALVNIYQVILSRLSEVKLWQNVGPLTQIPIMLKDFKNIL